MGNAASAQQAQDLVQAALNGEVGNVTAMIKGGIAIESQDAAGNHALGAAACGGWLELCQKLVEAGAPLELKNQLGTTPLWLAAGCAAAQRRLQRRALALPHLPTPRRYGHKELLEYFISKGADVNAVPLPPPSSLLVWLLSEAQLRCVCAQGNLTNDTPMLAAASKNHPGCVEALVAAGARHLIVNKSGDSPLSLACAMSSFAMAEMILPLPATKALINRKNEKGISPVTSAASAGNVQIMTALLAAGGDATERDANGATPLHLAAFCGQEELVQMLLAVAGVEIECKDSTGATPLWLAAAGGHEQSLLVLIAAGGDQVRSSPNTMQML